MIFHKYLNLLNKKYTGLIYNILKDKIPLFAYYKFQVNYLQLLLMFLN